MAIDLGIGFDDAKKAAELPVDVGGPYEFVLDEITDTQTNEGRDGWTFWLKVVNNPKYPNVRVPYNTYFPWTNPSTGMRDDGGLTFLTNMFLGIGAAWQGTVLPEKAELLGKTGFFRITLGKDRQTGEDRKQVRIITKKKR